MYLTFEEGRVEISPWHGGDFRVYRRGQSVESPVIEGGTQNPNDNFIDAILGRALLLTSPQNGILQSELMDAIYESARTGQITRLNS